jgi:hypothetical protein
MCTQNQGLNNLPWTSLLKISDVWTGFFEIRGRDLRRSKIQIVVGSVLPLWYSWQFSGRSFVLVQVTSRRLRMSVHVHDTAAFTQVHVPANFHRGDHNFVSLHVASRRLCQDQLGSNRPSPEQGILVVWAFFFGLEDDNRLKTRTML